MVHRSGSACFSPQRSPNVTGSDMNLIKEPEPDCLPLKDEGRLPNDDPLQDDAYPLTPTYTTNYHPTPVLVTTKTEPLTDNDPVVTANKSPNIVDSSTASTDNTIYRPELSLRCRLPLNKLRRILHKIKPMKRNIIRAPNLVPKSSDPALTDSDVVVDASNIIIAPSAGIECDKLVDPCTIDETDTKLKTKSGMLTVDRVLCLYCDRSFVTASLQNRHVQRVHRENPGRRSSGRTAHLQTQGDFSGCGFCTENATTRSTNLLDLFAHMVEKHADNYFACRKCVVRFTTSENLNIHLSEVHGQSVDLKVVLRNNDIDDIIMDKRLTNVRKANSPELQIGDSNAIDFEQNIAVNILTMGISGPIEQKTNPKIIITESNNSPQTKVSQKPQKMALNNLAQEQNEPMLSRLGITQNRSPGTKKSKMRKNDLKSPLNDKKIKVKPDVQDFFINKNINSKNELFDSKFDKNFYENVSKNVNENLSNYLDGKINNIPGMSKSELEITPPLTASNENSVRIHESNSSLSTISSFPTLLSSEQYGAIGPPNNPKLPRKKATKNSWKWKFDFVKKYKYYNENGKMVKKVKPTYRGTCDLSKLDMWTQLAMKNKYDLEKSKDKQNNEEEQTECDDRKEKLRLLGELNSILDTRLFPKLNLEQECSSPGIKQETECHIEKSENEVKFTRRKSCRINDICASLAKVTASNIATRTISGDHTIDSINFNKQNSNIIENTSVSTSDRSQPVVDRTFLQFDSNNSSEESFSNYLNLKPKTDVPNTPISPEVYLSGEWERPRCYICVGCGLKLNTLKELEDHKSSEHPHIFSTYYEIVGKEMINSEVYKLFHLPGAQHTGKLLVDVKQNTNIAKGSTGDSIVCTKCSKTVALSERYRHMLECSGDYAYLLAKKKSRYRPFGTRSRRRKASMHGCQVTRRRPTTVIKKIRRNTKNSSMPRSKPSDAETIQRMLANLPAKRLSRHIVPLPRPRPRLKKQVQIKQKTNTQQTKVVSGNRHLLHNRASRSRSKTFLQSGNHKPTWTELQRLKNSKKTRNTRKTTMSKRNIKADVDTDADVDVESVDIDIDSEEIDVESIDDDLPLKMSANKKSGNTSGVHTKHKMSGKLSKTVVIKKSKKDVGNTKNILKTNQNKPIRKSNMKTNIEISHSHTKNNKTSLSAIIPKPSKINILDMKKDKANTLKQNLKSKTSSIIDETDYNKDELIMDKAKKSASKIKSKKSVKIVTSEKSSKKLDKDMIKNSAKKMQVIEANDLLKNMVPKSDVKSSTNTSKPNSNINIKIKSKNSIKKPVTNNLLKESKMQTKTNKSSIKKSYVNKVVTKKAKVAECEKLKHKEFRSTNHFTADDADSDSKSDDFPLAHIKMRYKNKTQVMKNKANQGLKNNKAGNKKLKHKTNKLKNKLPVKSKRKHKLTDNLKENIIIVNAFLTHSVKNTGTEDIETKCSVREKTSNETDMPTLEKISHVSSSNSEDTCPILSPIVDNKSSRVAPLLLKSNCALNITPLLEPKLFESEPETNLKIVQNLLSEIKKPEGSRAIENLTETKMKQNEAQNKMSENACSVKSDLPEIEINNDQISIPVKGSELDCKTSNICDTAKPLQVVENSPSKVMHSPTKRRSKKLNDCIAMLTDKLQSKLSDNPINSFNVLQSFQIEPSQNNPDSTIIASDEQPSPIMCIKNLDDLSSTKDLLNKPAVAIESTEILIDSVDVQMNKIKNQRLTSDVSNLINKTSELNVKPTEECNNVSERDDNLNSIIDENESSLDKVHVDDLTSQVIEESKKIGEVMSGKQDIFAECMQSNVMMQNEETEQVISEKQHISDEAPSNDIKPNQEFEQDMAEKENIEDQVLSKMMDSNEDIDQELNQKMKPNVRRIQNKKPRRIRIQETKLTKKAGKKVHSSKHTRKSSIHKTDLESAVHDNSPLEIIVPASIENEISCITNTSSGGLEHKLIFDELSSKVNDENKTILTQVNCVPENDTIDQQKEKNYLSLNDITALNPCLDNTEFLNKDICKENEMFIASLSANDELYIKNALEVPNAFLNSNDEALNTISKSTDKSAHKAKPKTHRKKKQKVSIDTSKSDFVASPVSPRKSTPRKCKFSGNMTNIENEVEEVFFETLATTEDKYKGDLLTCDKRDSLIKKNVNAKKYKKISPFNDCSLIANEQLISTTIPTEHQLKSDISVDENDDLSKNVIKKCVKMSAESPSKAQLTENQTSQEHNNAILNENSIDYNDDSDARKIPLNAENSSNSMKLSVSKIKTNKVPINLAIDKLTNSALDNVYSRNNISPNKVSDSTIQNIQNISNGYLDETVISMKSDEIGSSDSEEDICLAVIAKILQNKPGTSNDELEPIYAEQEYRAIEQILVASTDMKIQNESKVVSEENTGNESIHSKLLNSESKTDSMNDSLSSRETRKARKKRKYKKSVLLNSKKNKQLKPEKSPEVITNNSANYCEICKKSFQRIESLNKHKITLTHIAKLSEIEFLNKRNDSKSGVHNICELEDVEVNIDKGESHMTISNEISTEEKCKKTCVEPQTLINEEFLPHAENVSKVDNTDDQNVNTLDNISDNTGLSAVNELSDINNRKALSVEEALFFECCSLLKSSEATKKEIPPETKTLGMNQYPTMPSATETHSLKLNHYSNKFSDISSDSNNLPTIQHMDLPKLQEDSCGSNLTAFLASVDQFINTPLINHAENNEYSPISNDGNFSPISNSGSPDKLDNFETDFKLHEPSQTNANNFSPISDQSESENVTCNIYTKTISTITLQETYLKSEAMSAICDIGKEFRSPLLETNLYKSREEIYSVENMIIHSNSSFSDVGDGCPTSIANSDEDSVAHVDEELVKPNQMSGQMYMENADLPPRKGYTGIYSNECIDSEPEYKGTSGDDDELTPDQRETDLNISLPSSPQSSKKIPTKGALKVFESLKVSIPTSEFNLEKVISSCANSKLAAFAEIALQREHSNEPFSMNQCEDNNIPTKNYDEVHIDKSHEESYLVNPNLKNEFKSNQETDGGENIISLNQRIKVKEISPKRQNTNKKDTLQMLPTCKKKNLVLTFGNNLGFRIKKKRIGNKKKHKTINKNKNKAINKHTIKDIYDFEDSQDNIDFGTNKLTSYVSNKLNLKCEFLNNTNDENLHEENGDTLKNSGNFPVSDEDDDDDFDYLSDHLTDISSIESSEIVKPRIDSEVNPKRLIVGKIFRKNLKEKSEEPNLDELFDNLLSENIENSKCEEVQIQEDETERILDKSNITNENSNQHIISVENKSDDNETIKQTDSSKNQQVNTAPVKANSRKSRSKSIIEQELGMSFQQIKEIIGFAQRKSQRKCTTGKQNVLAENWSSDEDFESRLKKDKTKTDKRISKENIDYKIHTKSQTKKEDPDTVMMPMKDKIPISSEISQDEIINKNIDLKETNEKMINLSTEDMIDKCGPKVNGFSEKAQDSLVNNIPPRTKRKSLRSLADDSSSDSECESKKKRARKTRRRRRTSSGLKDHQTKLINTSIKSANNESITPDKATSNGGTLQGNTLVGTLSSSLNVETLTSNNKKSKHNATDLDAQTAAILSLPRRKRVSTDMLYYWSSSSDEDQYAGMIEVKPIRDDVNLTEHPIQHGWIVGDSHKKLVTLLAHTKGKKTEDCVVKETHIKKNRHTL